MIIGITFLVTIVGAKIVPKFIVSQPEDIFGEPVQVREGLYVAPEAMGKVTDEELQELIDEYGENAEIRIYEVGPY